MNIGTYLLVLFVITQFKSNIKEKKEPTFVSLWLMKSIRFLKRNLLKDFFCTIHSYFYIHVDVCHLCCLNWRRSNINIFKN